MIEFQERFSDFRENKFIFDLFTDPFNINVYESQELQEEEQLQELSEELQMELIELQSNDMIKLKFQKMHSIEFYQYLQYAFADSYSKIKENALKVICMFGSTYLCEQLFSVLKLNKSKQRSLISDQHLNDCMKIIFARNISPNIDKIISEMQCQSSH